MPAKTWTSEAEFDTGTYSDTIGTGGALALSGATVGYWESPIYEAASWDDWRQFLLSATIPEGCSVLFQFKTGATSGACDGASYGDYMPPQGSDASGNIRFDLNAYYLNNPSPAPGGFIQARVHLFGE